MRGDSQQQRTRTVAPKSKSSRTAKSKRGTDARLAQWLSILSGSPSVPQARLLTLQAVREQFDARLALWIEKSATSTDAKLLFPRRDPRAVQAMQSVSQTQNQNFATLRGGLFLSSSDDSPVGIWVIDPKKAASQPRLQRAKIIVRHAEQVTERLEQMEKLRLETLTDELTGLWNARFLRWALTHHSERAKSLGQKFSVLFVDVDRFKSINDQNGHLVGSELLAHLGARLKACVRDSDLVFRYGGDEFVIILSDSQGTDAVQTAERLRLSVEKSPFLVQGKQVTCTLSIGVASCPDQAKTGKDLIQLADHAMYEAKRLSRNRVYWAVTV